MRKIAWILVLAGCGSKSSIATYNQEPAVSIQNPTDQSTFDEGDQIDFQGNIKDDQTDPELLIVQWESNIDGVLSSETQPDATGLVLLSTNALTVGNHTITLSAVDERGERGEYSIGLTIADVPDAPTITIVHPIAGESGLEGSNFSFSAQVSDEQDAPSQLQVSITSNLVGAEPFCTPAPDVAGLAACDYSLPTGDHTLTFRVIDSDGLDASTQVLFPVISGDDDDYDGDGFTENQRDCDDTNPNINALATEIYNNVDDDCDGLIDEGTENFDDDFDGQRELDGDCDDTDNTIYLGAVETCDARDNDCDFVVDETTQCYDDDGDGLTEVYGDCNDASAVSYPNAPEVEDGLDNDCDGTVDEGTRAFDDDGDGTSENNGDCDDSNAGIYVGATESCNGLDDDCDLTADEENATGCSVLYYDYDGDSFGSSSISGSCVCGPTGYYTSPYATDCYDYNSAANPIATTPSTSSRGDNSWDWNCDGQQVKQDQSSGSCNWNFGCDLYTGWQSSPPSCGQTGNYVTSCTLACGVFCCNENTVTVTQSCL